MEAIFYFEGLTQRSLLGTGAHGAWANSLGITSLYRCTAYVASHALFPQFQIDFRQSIAWDSRIQEGIGDVKHGTLHVGHLVTMITNDFRQGAFADLG